MTQSRRIAIVFDGSKWHVRRIRLIELDLDKMEMVYRCDDPISNDHATLADVPQVADLIAAAQERALR